VAAMHRSHIYEEVAHDIILLENQNSEVGSGIIGELSNEMSETAFFAYLKQNMDVRVIRHTKLLGKPIRKVALCGGAGSFLLGDAILQLADVFITADFKYHEFFDADNRIIIADIGHYESEQFTSNILAEKIKENFTNFAIHLTEHNTNPINYF
jgi:putative NIF3 family GTP cyclohydrolase 1 type 2